MCSYMARYRNTCRLFRLILLMLVMSTDALPVRQSRYAQTQNIEFNKHDMTGQTAELMAEIGLLRSETRELVSMISSESDEHLPRIVRTENQGLIAKLRDSVVTARIAVALAATPIALSMTAHTLRNIARYRGTWEDLRMSLLVQVAEGFLSIPIGIGVLVLGFVLGDLEIGLVGVSTLAYVYASQAGSRREGAERLFSLFQWCPNVITMDSWRANQEQQPVTLSGAANPSRGQQIFRMLTTRGAAGPLGSTVGWTDEVMVALLAIKFVALSEAELCWKECDGGQTIRELINQSERVRLSWEGGSGKWAREWISLQDVENSESSEPTLRFVIALHEHIRSHGLGKGSYGKEQRLLFRKIIDKRRANDGNMSWAHTILKQ